MGRVHGGKREREWLHCNHAVTTTPTRRTTTTVHTKHTYTTILYESIYECHAYIYPVFYSIHCLSNVDDVDMIERLFGYLLGEKKLFKKKKGSFFFKKKKKKKK